MRISDWSLDVCSSDLLAPESVLLVKRQRPPGFGRQGIGLGFRRYWRRASGEIIFAAEGRGLGNVGDRKRGLPDERSEEHTSELQSLMRISYAVFCLNKKT